MLIIMEQAASMIRGLLRKADMRDGAGVDVEQISGPPAWEPFMADHGNATVQQAVAAHQVSCLTSSDEHR